MALLPATLPPDAEARISPESGTGPGEGSPWVEREDGKLRFRVEPEGFVRAEKSCRRCKRGWKKKWKLRLPAAAEAPPVTVGKLVCVGALDNRVYCLKARNGHRRWTADVGGRVSQPLVHWPGPPEAEERRGALLAVLEGGSSLALLGAEDGKTIGSLEFGAAEGKIVDVPLAAPDGRLVLARQGYADSDAVLAVYRLEPSRIDLYATDGEAVEESADDEQ